MNTRSSHGFSLVELLLVLGVLAVLLLAAFVVYPQVRDRNQVNTEISNLVAIKANVLALYGNRDMTALDTAIANQAHFFPARMNGGDYSAAAVNTTAWGGIVYMGRGGGGTNRFNVLYTLTPPGVCTSLVTSAARHYNSIRIGSGPYRLVTEVMAADGQLDLDAVASACQYTTNVHFSYVR